MSQILVFSCEGDPALATARLVADWTVARLQQEGHLVTAQMGPNATPAALEQSLPPHDGLAAFSHGREDALLDGQGQVLLAQSNIHLLSNKWAWLFACRTAGALGALALHAGVRCFAGFAQIKHIFKSVCFRWLIRSWITVRTIQSKVEDWRSPHNRCSAV